MSIRLNYTGSNDAHDNTDYHGLWDTQVSLNDSMVGPCCVHLPERDDVLVDVSAVLRRLLLFDTYILQSVRLKEFPALVRALGADAVIRLLSSRALRIECDAVAIGQNSNSFGPRQSKRPLPKGSYSFIALRGGSGEHYGKYVHENLAGVQFALKNELTLKKIIRLKQAIVDALVPRREDAGQEALRQLTTDLDRNDRLLHASLLHVLSTKYRLLLKPSEVSLSFSHLDDTDFRSETNLECLGIDEETKHKAVEAACLGIAGMNLRIEEMKAYSATSGFIDSESCLLSERLGSIARDFSPGVQEQRVERVLSIRGFPQFGAHEPTKCFNADRFLEVRSSKECQEFRAWIHRIDSASDAEIADQINSLRARIGDLAQTRPGKIIRFLVAGIAGLIPKIGVEAGLAMSALDMFALEKLLPKSGPIAFLNRQYPSIFTRAPRI